MNGIIIKVMVKPNSPKFSIHSNNKLEVKSPPERGRANREIINNLRRITGCDIEIISGLTSKRKTILIKGISKERLLIIILKNT